MQKMLIVWIVKIPKSAKTYQAFMTFIPLSSAPGRGISVKHCDWVQHSKELLLTKFISAILVFLCPAHTKTKKNLTYSEPQNFV